jgi:hypothetical protein
MREEFAEPMEPRRCISGTTAIFCTLVDCDDDEVRSRSPEGRSRGRSPSAGVVVEEVVVSSSLLEAEERGLRALELLWRSRSRSLSRSRSRSRSRSLSLLLGLLESFLLRRRAASGELMVGAGGLRRCWE